MNIVTSADYHTSILDGYSGARIGRVVGASADGHPLVVVEESLGQPVVARLALYGLEDPQPLIDDRASVVLVFENAEPGLPIIVGALGARENSGKAASPTAIRATEPVDDIESRVQEFVIESKDKIVLRVGKASITLTEDGRVITRAANIISRASGVNDIKGASVRIN